MRTMSESRVPARTSLDTQLEERDGESAHTGRISTDRSLEREEYEDVSLPGDEDAQS